ncbi:methyltransferase domain-containing protein [Actinoplanes sp. NPDC051851]|uniref:methyltransferase domain-containing protein n=1 Tax=Actinoplanes sp. NPDC051851 TaxID=3154753 RepID=UPI00344A93F7
MAGPSYRYSFDNGDPIAARRHRILAEIGDPVTVARLEALGDLRGRRCLELGAGAGSVAAWLAGRGAEVLATDLDVRHLRADRGYTVLRHDLTAEPVPESPWDLIHARLLLLHLPGREEILRRLASALAPGGALLVEEWASGYRGLVLAAPDPESAALVDRYQDVLVERLLPGNGHDPYWAGRVHGAMVEAGLTGVDTEIRAGSWAGGTAGALLHAVNLVQLREGFLAAGFSAAELDRLSALCADPRLVVRGHLLYSTLGRARRDAG